MGRRNRKRAKPAARSLENPATPLNLNDDDALEILGGGATAAGVRVTERKALGYPAVWRAVNLIAGDVAKLSLLVYRTTGEGRAVDTAHPAYRLTKYKANDGLLAYDFKRVVQFRALMRGNGYGYIMRTAGGRPTGINLLDSKSVQPFRNGGRVYYEYEPAPGEKTIIIPAADVFHIKGLGDDGLQGYDALAILRESIGAAIAARDYGARNFKNSARPGGLIKHPGKLSAQARNNMRESWHRLHGGPENAHKVGILEEGSDFVPLGGSARDAQLLENREFDSREVANIFGVPAHKLGDPSKVAYNSLGEENQSYYDDTLSHWLNQWAAEASDKLLSEQEKLSESHVIDFDYRQVKRANLASLTAYATAAVGKWASVDEIREAFGDNPLPDGQGKWQGTQPAPAPEPAADADPPADDPPPAERKLDGLRAVIEDAARRMARRMVSHAARLAGKGQRFADWFAIIEAEHGEVIRAALAPAVEVARDCGVVGLASTEGRALAELVAEGVKQAWPDYLEAGADALVDHVAGRMVARMTEAA
jgi:HK97 family phage portal protein